MMERTAPELWTMLHLPDRDSARAHTKRNQAGAVSDGNATAMGFRFDGKRKGNKGLGPSGVHGQGISKNGRGAVVFAP